MDTATIEKGRQIQNMTTTDGWKHFSEWLDKREKEYIDRLRRSDSFKDILKHQAFLEFIEKERAFIKNAIQDMYNELKKEIV